MNATGYSHSSLVQYLIRDTQAQYYCTCSQDAVYYIIIQYTNIQLLQLSIQILTTIMHTTVSTCIYIISCLRDNTAITSYHALQTIQQVHHIMHYRQYSKYTISCITDNTASTPYHALQTIQQVHHIMHYRQYSKYTISCTTGSTPHYAYITHDWRVLSTV